MPLAHTDHVYQIEVRERYYMNIVIVCEIRKSIVKNTFLQMRAHSTNTFFNLVLLNHAFEKHTRVKDKDPCPRFVIEFFFCKLFVNHLFLFEAVGHRSTNCV